MNKDIVLRAWDFVRNDTKIKKFYFFPGIISMLFLMIISVYQVLYTYVELFGNKEAILQTILNMFHTVYDSGYFWEVAVTLLVFLVIYILFIPMCEWALITYISKKKPEESYTSITESIQIGLYRFLPLFEYSNAVSQFKFLSLINSYLFCLRFVWMEYIFMINVVFAFLLLVSTTVNILFMYCRFEIVLNGKRPVAAIGSSIRIAILHLSTTIKLYFFLFFVNIRVIINFVAFLIFPILIASILTFIISKTILIIMVVFVSILFFFFTVFLWYLWGVFEIFKTCVRYYAYLEGKQKVHQLEWNEPESDNDEDL